jgi:hypothetical protein
LVEGGDDTTRPRRQGTKKFLFENYADSSVPETI